MSDKSAKITAKSIQALYAEIAKSITSSLDSSIIIHTIMEKVHQFFQPNNWSLLRVDNDNNELYFVVAKGLEAATVKDLRLKVGEGVVGFVAKTGTSVLVPDVASDPRFNSSIDQISGFKTTSLVAVAIKFQGSVLGVIELINTLNEGPFTDEELEVLETIADFSAIALNNAMIHEQMIFMANHDPLTDLYNRAYLAKLYTDSEALSLSDYPDTYTIAVLIDVDRFKEINDQYGHAAGDKVLVRLADMLKSSCRRTDYVFRVGGDEFLVVLTNLDIDEIPTLENEMRKKLLGYLEKASLDFSFSFGIASGKSADLEQVILTADSKMYVIKRSRNEDATS